MSRTLLLHVLLLLRHIKLLLLQQLSQLPQLQLVHVLITRWMDSAVSNGRDLGSVLVQLEVVIVLQKRGARKPADSAFKIIGNFHVWSFLC